MGVWCTKIETDDEAIRAAYEGGETISSIAERLGLGFGTVQRRLTAAGASMRKNSWNRFDHRFEDMRRMYVDEKLSHKLVAKVIGANPATVLRYLRQNGVAIRPDSSVPVYEHVSPCAGKIVVRGTWELCYAKILDIWFGAGRIAGWQYESERIDTSAHGAGRHYRPDFKVLQKEGPHAFHEVKGYLREHSARKLAAARATGARIVVVRGKLLQAICDHYGIPIETKGAN
jgi:hypothetical protein